MDDATRGALGELLGASVVEVHPIRESRVWRVRVAGRYEPVIVKSGASGNEVVALDVLGSYAPGLAPRLIATDAALGLLVQEDVGGQASLADLLLGDDAERAEAGMVAWASALGRLHAATAPHIDAIRAARTASPLDVEDNGFLGDVAEHWRTVEAALRDLDVDVPAGCDDELAAALVTLDDPAWQVLLHGDACPDNNVAEPSFVLFDWEGSSVGHAMLDGSYIRLPFPTCWCAGRIPEAVATAMEDEYRRAAAPGLPAVDDAAAYDTGLAAVVAWWVQSSVWGLRRSVEGNPSWGTSTHRHRLVHKAGVVRECVADRYPALAALAAEVGTWVGSRWPDAADGLPLYPAFHA